MSDQVYALVEDNEDYYFVYGYVIGPAHFEHRLQTVLKVAKENLYLAQKQWRKRTEAFSLTLDHLDPYNKEYLAAYPDDKWPNEVMDFVMPFIEDLGNTGFKIFNVSEVSDK